MEHEGYRKQQGIFHHRLRLKVATTKKLRQCCSCYHDHNPHTRMLSDKHKHNRAETRLLLEEIPTRPRPRTATIRNGEKRRKGNFHNFCYEHTTCIEKSDSDVTSHKWTPRLDAEVGRRVPRNKMSECLPLLHGKRRDMETTCCLLSLRASESNAEQIK